MMRRTILLLAAVALVAAVSIPVAVAAGSKTPSAISPKKAEGTWTWVNTAWEVWKVTDKAKYVSGSEDGTWTGTLEGTSVDTFGAKLWRHSAGGGLEGALNISFTGTVEGKSGTLNILTWMIRYEACSPWTIASGTDELANTRGYGTWCWGDAGAEYTGTITEYVPPTPSPTPSTSTSTSPSP
jgi:hypothetical protein